MVLVHDSNSFSNTNGRNVGRRHRVAYELRRQSCLWYSVLLIFWDRVWRLNIEEKTIWSVYEITGIPSTQKISRHDVDLLGMSENCYRCPTIGTEHPKPKLHSEFTGGMWRISFLKDFNFSPIGSIKKKQWYFGKQNMSFFTFCVIQWNDADPLITLMFACTLLVLVVQEPKNGKFWKWYP